jgi:hypothetical protein
MPSAVPHFHWRLLGDMIVARLLLLGQDFNEKRSVSLAGLSVLETTPTTAVH